MAGIGSGIKFTEVALHVMYSASTGRMSSVALAIGDGRNQ